MGAFPYAQDEGVGRYLDRMKFFDYRSVFSSGDRATDKVVKTDRSYEAQRAAGNTVKPTSANSADGAAAPKSGSSSPWTQEPSPTAASARSRAVDHESATRSLLKIAEDLDVRSVEVLQTSSGTTFVSMLNALGDTVAFDYDETVAAAWNSRRGVVAVDPADANALRELLQAY